MMIPYPKCAYGPYSNLKLNPILNDVPTLVEVSVSITNSSKYVELMAVNLSATATR